MQRLLFKTSAVGVLSCAAIQTGNVSYSAGSKDNNVNIPYASSEQIILTPMLPGSEKKASNNFMVVYDKRTRNPKYVVERLYQSGLACSDDEDANLKKKKRHAFFSDPAIESEVYRVSRLSARNSVRLI